MTNLVRRTPKLGAVMLDLFLSAVGCFVLMRCFRSITAERESSHAVESIGAAGTVGKPGARIAAALFLMAYALSEASAVNRGRRH